MSYADCKAQYVQVKFYTQAGIDALEQGRPSPLPNVEKDAVSASSARAVTNG